MGQSENTVTIYQNGIAAFERTYEVGEEPKRLSLPFKKDVIGDVAATLSILGSGIEITEAPNYSANKETPALVIDPAKCNSDLFTKLSGAAVTVTLSGARSESVKGRVTGYTTENNVLQGGVQITQHWLTIQQDDGCFKRLSFNQDVAGFTFTDPAIQSLVKKALDYNVEKINPESVYLNTTLKSSKPSKALVKYAIPSPAFKLTYRIKQASKGGWTLYGFGVVDNNTDEDWTNFNVNCATGQPVTFATDIADIRIPTRTKVNLVNEQAVGAVEAESGVTLESFGGGMETARGGTRSMKRGLAAAPAAACASFANVVDVDDASQAVATAVEIGDSSFFRGTEPVTIPAKKSALVKIIEQKLKDTESCLYYQPNKNRTRIMRALKTKNEATYTLERGVVAIEQQGAHVGSAIMTLCKPGDTAMLCHAAETGVKVLCEVGQERSKCGKHSLAEGLLSSEWTKTRTTVYTFRNNKEEEFTLLFDHARHLAGSTITIDGCTEQTKLSDGVVRYSVVIPAKGEEASGTTVTLTENLTTHTQVKAGDFLDWMQRNPESPLLKVPGLNTVVNLYKELQGVNAKIAQENEKLTNLKGEQERIRKNCEAMKGTTGTGNDIQAYFKRLIAADDEINTLEKTTIPSLNKQVNDLKTRIREAVAQCTANWTAPNDEPPITAKVVRQGWPE